MEKKTHLFDGVEIVKFVMKTVSADIPVMDGFPEIRTKHIKVMGKPRR